MYVLLSHRYSQNNFVSLVFSFFVSFVVCSWESHKWRNHALFYYQLYQVLLKQKGLCYYGDVNISPFVLWYWLVGWLVLVYILDISMSVLISFAHVHVFFLTKEIFQFTIQVARLLLSCQTGILYCHCLTDLRNNITNEQQRINKQEVFC